MTDQANAQPGEGTDTAATATTAPDGAAAADATATAVTTTANTAADPAADTGTLVGTAETAPEKIATAPADFPADWREKMAGGDAKALEQLKRYNSPADVWTKTRALEQRLSSGDLKKALAKDAKPEEVAAWRKENGLPEKEDGYIEKLALPEGVVLGEADKPLTLGFAEAALKGNVTPEQFSGLVAKYYEMQDKMAQERAEADQVFKQKAEDELRSEWGADYRPYLNAVKNLLAGMPEGAADNLLAGRFADGTRIGDNPGFVKWLATMSRDLNPTATLLPAGTSDAGKSVSDEIANMEKLMGDSGSDYWRGPKADAMQERYRKLVDARDRLKSQAA